MFGSGPAENECGWRTHSASAIGEKNLDRDELAARRVLSKRASVAVLLGAVVGTVGLPVATSGPELGISAGLGIEQPAAALPRHDVHREVDAAVVVGELATASSAVTAGRPSEYSVHGAEAGVRVGVELGVEGVDDLEIALDDTTHVEVAHEVVALVDGATVSRPNNGAAVGAYDSLVLTARRNGDEDHITDDTSDWLIRMIVLRNYLVDAVTGLHVGDEHVLCLAEVLRIDDGTTSVVLDLDLVHVLRERVFAMLEKMQDSSTSEPSTTACPGLRRRYATFPGNIQ